jgi:hypothetical protein
MERGSDLDHASNLNHAEGPPRTTLHVEFRCSRCGGGTAFDGSGGEWCPHCRTSEHVTAKRHLYRLADIELD